jgi:hypothetical protein
MPTTSDKPPAKPSADEQTAPARAAAQSVGDSVGDEQLGEKVADALDPTTGGGVQDVVRVPSVLKTGAPDQTPGHVVMDPEAAEHADDMRKAAGPAAVSG